MARIIYRDEEVDVEYNLYGAHIPATYENPEEYPDVIITQVYYKEVDILLLLKSCLNSQLTKEKNLFNLCSILTLNSFSNFL